MMFKIKFLLVEVYIFNIFWLNLSFNHFAFTSLHIVCLWLRRWRSFVFGLLLIDWFFSLHISWITFVLYIFFPDHRSWWTDPFAAFATNISTFHQFSLNTIDNLAIFLFLHNGYLISWKYMKRVTNILNLQHQM